MEYSFKTLPLQHILHQASQKDKLYISNFAKIQHDGSTLRAFKIIPNPDSVTYNDKYWIVRLIPDSSLFPTTSTSDTNDSPHLHSPLKNKGKKRALEPISSTDHQPDDAESSSSRKRKPRLHSRIQQLTPSSNVIPIQRHASELPTQLLECHLYGEISFLETGPYGNWVPRDANNVDNISFPKEDARQATISITLRATAPIAESLKIIDDEWKELLKKTDEITNYNYMGKKDQISIKYPLFVSREAMTNFEGT